jgi:hypothetical protein
MASTKARQEMDESNRLLLNNLDSINGPKFAQILPQVILGCLLILKKLAIKGNDIKIGWGKPSQVPTSVALAVQQSGASRNVISSRWHRNGNEWQSCYPKRR